MLKIVENKDYDVAVCGGGFAGIAAAMTDDFEALDVKAVQERLKARNIPLHEADIHTVKGAKK